MAHVTRGWCTYLPSMTAQYGAAVSIKVDSKTASANGNTVSNMPPQAVYWPGHTSDMRAVYGQDSGGAKDKCIAFSATGSLFALAATFTDMEGNTYTVNALRGEKFRVKNLK